MDILVEELDGSLWVAAVEKGRIDDLEVDPGNEEVRWGSIYYGRVERIDKALDAAFIDLDGENTGLLNGADIRILNKNGSVKKGGNEPLGQLLKAGQMVVVQAKSGYQLRPDDEDRPESDKHPKVSMDITIPGRYMVFAPFSSANRLSGRIRDKKLRRQMNRMLETIDTLKGFILRAAAANTQTDILIREGEILQSIWEQVQEHFTGEQAQLIMLGPGAVQRTLSDNADRRINRIEIVTMEQYQEVEEWCEIYAPDLVTKIRPVELDDPEAALGLFDARDILDQVEELFHPYALLTGGANIIIQETSALTAIDVNRGSHKGSNLDINLSAAEEAARQLRLRNLGGIIVIDFLKMKTKTEQGQLIARLEHLFNNDPCTVQIHGITPLGLIELTRKRRTPPLQDSFDGALDGA